MIRKKTAPQSFAPVLNSSSTQLHSNSYHRDKGFLHALELNESPFPKVGSPGKGEEGVHLCLSEALLMSLT